MVSALEKLNSYSCPGTTNKNKKGTVEIGQAFTVLGWDQTTEDGQVLYWLLVGDDVNQPQIWVRDSEFVLITSPNYRDFIPRIACRTVAP
jgi:hypothetical protein